MPDDQSQYRPATQLMEAILLEDEQESLRWVKELLESGEDPNQLDYDYYSPPLYEAWSTGRTKIVKLLIEHGALISTNHGPPNECFISTVPVEATLVLFEAGHSFIEYIEYRYGEPMSASGSNPLTYLLNDKCYEHIQAFEQYKIMSLLNVYNDCGLTPLGEMARDNNLIQARWLLEKNADVNAHCKCLVGYTALDNAVHDNHVEMIKLLLEAGANPNIRTCMNVCCTEHVQMNQSTAKKQRNNPSEQSKLKKIKDLVIDASKKFPYEPF